MDPVTAAIVSWVVGEAGGAARDKLAGLLGDKQERALRAIVRASVRQLAGAVEDDGLIEAALLLDAPDQPPVSAGAAVDLRAVIERQVRPRLEALAEQGYPVDIDLLSGRLTALVERGIQADAASDGPLKSMAELLRHQQLAAAGAAAVAELRRLGGPVAAAPARPVEFAHIGLPARTTPRWAEFPHRPEFLRCEFEGGCDRLFHLKDFVYGADLFFDLVLLNTGDVPAILSTVGVEIEAVQQLIYLYGHPEASKLKPAADEYEIPMPDLRANYDVGLMDNMRPDPVDRPVIHRLDDPVYLPAGAPYRYILHLREYQRNIPNHARIRLTAEVGGQIARSPRLHIFTW